MLPATTALILLPTLVYVAMAATSKFPPSERVAAGVPAGDMMREVLRPFFLVWFFSMFLTAAAELATIAARQVIAEGLSADSANGLIDTAITQLPSALSTRRAA